MEDIYIEEKFKNWLSTPLHDEHGDHGSFRENIESSCLHMIKKAFFDGCKLGYNFKLNCNFNEQMQK